MSSKEDRLHDFIFADTKRDFVPAGELAARMFILDYVDSHTRRDFSQTEEGERK